MERLSWKGPGLEIAGMESTRRGPHFTPLAARGNPCDHVIRYSYSHAAPISAEEAASISRGSRQIDGPTCLCETGRQSRVAFRGFPWLSDSPSSFTTLGTGCASWYWAGNLGNLDAACLPLLFGAARDSRILIIVSRCKGGTETLVGLAWYS